MVHVFFSNPAEHDLKRLSNRVQEMLRMDYIPLFASGQLSGKPLHGPLRGYFSCEFWVDGVAYRIAYELMKGDFVILMIDTRDNFYKKFTRRIH